MNRLLSISLTAALLAGITACGEQNDNTPIPIIDAIAFGDVEAVNQHLADNIDVNAPDELGRTLFHHAIAKGDYRPQNPIMEREKVAINKPRKVTVVPQVPHYDWPAHGGVHHPFVAEYELFGPAAEAGFIEL